MKRPTIRRALPDDAPGLALCLARAYAPHATLPGLPPVAKGVDEDIATRYVWIAVAGEEIVAGLVLDVQPGAARLVNLGVVPEMEGQGLARRLIKLAEAECRAWGADALRLTTHVDLDRARGLYERLGWRETGREAQRLFMEKPLR